MSENSKSNGLYYSDPQNLFIVLMSIITIAVATISFVHSGWQFLVLYMLGWLIGFSLFQAKYGFSSVYRQIVEDGNTEMLRGHMIKLMVAVSLFSMILSANMALFGDTPEGAIAPITFGLVIGSFLFGFGMEFGSGLAPAAMREAQGGRTASLFTVSGFLTGATFGAYQFSFWNTTLPAGPEVSLAEDTGLGYLGAWAVFIFFFLLISIGSYYYKKSTRPPKLTPMPRGTSWTRNILTNWPIWVGAIILAVLNALVLLVQGSPWKFTAAFSIWGSKIADAVGLDPASWGYWGDQEPLPHLYDSIFSVDLSVLNLGVLSGAIMTMALAGLIRFGKVPPSVMIISFIGGTIMGYGATISFGANVGAYFSGLASMSVHAIIWTAMAVTGVFAAYVLEKKYRILGRGYKS
ncbi:YeeE/YedE family protein [Salisediminibacterium beveridgei]|uniref:Uncharacterized protein n=1 Tax=Salisediminibacterium beveridgei TaxID=632773 RepID=A0A1D7QZ57_9BACI|nr:YeeE/YedE family protein [Salisediminibacterium beveridgei]AOM84288.1 hypothetical protein BBEV_2963 [Salisediminibacterium beveridgei]